MKHRIFAAGIIVCLLFSLLLPAAKAADQVYFSAINNTIFPLKNRPMPKFFDGMVYLPYTFFSSDELQVYSVSSSNEKILLYSSVSKMLIFDLTQTYAYDQDNTTYMYSAKLSNGAIYVPVELICSFFGLSYSVIQASPAPVVRVKTAAAVFNDLTFVSVNKTILQYYYNDYYGITPSSNASSPSPSAIVKPTYGDVTVYLSFSEISGGQLAAILDSFDSTRYPFCIFVSADEIAANADLLRRAVCEGHTIGILLKTGTYEEYQEASALLFEAAKAKTVIVTSGSDAAAAAAEMAASKNLLFWKSTKSYSATAAFTLSGITSKLSTTGGTRESIDFDCSTKTKQILNAFLAYLSQYKYGISPIKETSIPIIQQYYVDKI